MAVEAEVTTEHRAYLGAFDRWLRDPSPTHEAERATALAVFCNAPLRATEARVDYEEQPVEQTAQREPRPVKIVVAEALNEIRAREARIEGVVKRVSKELPECKAARKALERLLPVEATSPEEQASPTPAPVAPVSAIPAQRPKRQVASSQEVADRKATIYDAIKRLQPVDVATLASELGLEKHTVNNTLNQMLANGVVLKTGEGRGNVRWYIETAGDETAGDGQ